MILALFLLLDILVCLGIVFVLMPSRGDRSRGWG
jgi:hypothetical protein